jgi:hypothetical protein
MLARLNELKDYMYYFQYTITPYGNDVEPNIPSKTGAILPTFKQLSELVGPDRIVWRYDPIMVSQRYPMSYHLHAFEKIAAELHSFTKKVTISFIDVDYKGVKSNIKELALLPFPVEDQIQLSSKLAEIAHGYGLAIDTCAEAIDLSHIGIEHARCIDDRLFSKLLCCQLKAEKDKNQRPECGCIASIDIGVYNSCSNGCLYCYANYIKNVVARNLDQHNPLSPLLSGEVGESDKISDRAMKSYKDAQVGFL